LIRFALEDLLQVRFEPLGPENVLGKGQMIQMNRGLAWRGLDLAAQY
jgi:hypothetical protein